MDAGIVRVFLPVPPVCLIVVGALYSLF